MHWGLHLGLHLGKWWYATSTSTYSRPQYGSGVLSRKQLQLCYGEFFFVRVVVLRVGEFFFVRVFRPCARFPVIISQRISSVCTFPGNYFNTMTVVLPAARILVLPLVLPAARILGPAARIPVLVLLFLLSRPLAAQAGEAGRAPAGKRGLFLDAHLCLHSWRAQPVAYVENPFFLIDYRGAPSDMGRFFADDLCPAFRAIGDPEDRVVQRGKPFGPSGTRRTGLCSEVVGGKEYSG